MTRPDRRTSALVPALMVACLATAMFRPATAFNARSAPSRDDQAAPATPARFVARGSVVDASGSPVAGALVFSAGARGREMFPTTDHDLAAVRGALGTENVAGFFTSGEIGPLAGRNHVHGFSAAVLAFGA